MRVTLHKWVVQILRLTRRWWTQGCWCWRTRCGSTSSWQPSRTMWWKRSTSSTSLRKTCLCPGLTRCQQHSCTGVQNTRKSWQTSTPWRQPSLQNLTFASSCPVLSKVRMCQLFIRNDLLNLSSLTSRTARMRRTLSFRIVWQIRPWDANLLRSMNKSFMKIIAITVRMRARFLLRKLLLLVELLTGCIMDTKFCSAKLFCTVVKNWLWELRILICWKVWYLFKKDTFSYTVQETPPSGKSMKNEQNFYCIFQ